MNELNAFRNTRSNTSFWVAACLAKETRELYSNKDSYNFKTLYAGEWQGISSSAMPAWDRIPCMFKSLEEAHDYVKYLADAGYDFVIFPQTIKYYKVYRSSMVIFDIEQEV